MNKIPDNRITASSYYDSYYYPYYGRLYETRGRGWCPKTKSIRSEYLQIDLGARHALCAIATQGINHVAISEWTSRYKLSISLDGINWFFHQEHNKDKVFNIGMIQIS